MTSAAPDTSETRAEVARMTASRAPAPTTRRHAGEPPHPPTLRLIQVDQLKVVLLLFQVFRHVFPGRGQSAHM